MGTQIPKKVPMGTRVPKWGPIWEQCVGPSLRSRHASFADLLPRWLHCLGLPCWHYQFVLSWYLHQPESHQLSLQNVLDGLTEIWTH